MSGRELLEGMSYVDERFVDEAETQTIQKRVINPWMRLLPVAACLCILLVGVVHIWDLLPFNAKSTEGSVMGDQESALDTGKVDGGEESESQKPAGGDPQSWLYQTQYIRTDGGNESSQYPSYVIIHSRDELEQYYDNYKEIYDLEHHEQVYSDTTIGFLDAIEQYDDAFFADRDLIILVLEEGSGSIRHEVNGIRPYYDNTWQLTVRRITPEVCTDDMALWHLLIEVQKNLIAEDETIVVDVFD